MSLGSTLADCLRAGESVILVRVERAEGSTPREGGAAMLVTRGTSAGTIGGGALEMEAILEARRMLGAGAAASRLDIPLGPAIGQCCGGRVLLSFRQGSPELLAEIEAGEAVERAARPAVVVFGAGHTGQALARALLPLPFALTVVDPRPKRLAELPPEVARVATPLPEAEIAKAPPGSAFVIMTHDHALDFLIAAAALERADAAYVGMIGSATKREKFRRHLDLTGRGAAIARLVLPLGGSAVRDKRPVVIAALTAAELLAAFAALENTCTGFARGQSQCNNILTGGRTGRPGLGQERHAATS